LKVPDEIPVALATAAYVIGLAMALKNTLRVIAPSLDSAAAPIIH